jgi:hypothetical protein
MAVGHRWKPGEVTNPRGRPPVSLSLADAIRRKFPPEKMVEIAESLLASKDDRVRLGAFQTIQERGYGKVLSTVEITTHQPDASVDWSKVSMERKLELLAAADQMEALAPVDESEAIDVGSDED